jgi:hypothetical protein
MSHRKKTLHIDLVFNPTCPYIDEARKLIEKLKTELPNPIEVQEWDTSNPEIPQEFLRYTMPAFIVEGKHINPDIEGSCRCHRPHKKLLSYNAFKTAAIRAIRGKTPWYLVLASIPTALLSIIPFAGCPCSLVALMAFLSSIGLSWVHEYIVPLFASFLALTLLCLYIMAMKSERYVFFVFGLISSVVLCVGKWYQLDILAHFGIGGLISASLLSILYKKIAKR